MSNSIFDLEQQLLSCWHVTDDIDLVYKLVGDDPMFESLDAKAADDLMNLLLGLKSIYDLRFQTAWNTFEDVCKEYHTLNNTRESFDGVDEYNSKNPWAALNGWPKDSERMDVVGQNGNDGLHYKRGVE